jgi:hypothetical protein
MKNNNLDFLSLKIKKFKIKIFKRINLLIIMNLKISFKIVNQPGQ